MQQISPAEITKIIKRRIESYAAPTQVEESGSIIQVGDGIAYVYGLPGVMAGELLELSNGTYGMALNLEEEAIGVVVMGSDVGIKEGDPVRRTRQTTSVPVGDAMLGRVVNALGEPIDGEGPIAEAYYAPIEKNAPAVIERSEVNESLFTGIKAIDALVPIGKGQRELIIGDRETGKTAIAIDTILNQKDRGVKCVYVAIGQKASTVARIIHRLKEADALSYTTVVLATASDPASLQYIAPYAGTSIAEYWLEKGEDALIIYDDLSKHAVAYREISLLLNRPPGREAYPGDVFYLHSRLLERAARMSDAHGGGTLTALPIIETQGGDISAYIPTNVISITDGQIYLEADLFNSGIRPAINPGLSVSRVGGSAQIKAMRQIAGPLRIEYAQYNELSAFAQFGSDLNPDTLARLEHGQRIVEILKQPQYSPLRIGEQVIVFYALNENYFKPIEIEDIYRYERALLDYIDRHHEEVITEIEASGELKEEAKQIIANSHQHVLDQYHHQKKA